MTTAGDPPSYHFVTSWRVWGAVEEVAGLLFEGVDYPRWWPSVYLDVETRDAGDERGIGRSIDLHTKGMLPYHLHWTARITDVDLPNGYELDATGDFVGHGAWTFRQDGDWVEVVYDWEVGVEKPLLRRLSPVLRPLFAANHRWAMAQGLRSLELELERRHATSDIALAVVPAPPRPIPDVDTRMVVGVVATLALVVLLARSRRR